MNFNEPKESRKNGNRQTGEYMFCLVFINIVLATAEKHPHHVGQTQTTSLHYNMLANNTNTMEQYGDTGREQVRGTYNK
jgi:hypothetical protein